MYVIEFATIQALAMFAIEFSVIFDQNNNNNGNEDYDDDHLYRRHYDNNMNKLIK